MKTRVPGARPILAGFLAGVAFSGGVLGLRSVLADGIPTKNPLYYAGTLMQGGQPVNAPHQLTVNLWNSAKPQTGEVALCSTNASSTPVIAGRFRLALDPSCKAAVNANSDAYVEVVVDGATSFGRAKIGAVPYAVEADHAVGATTAVTAASATAVTGSVSSTMFRVSSSCSTPMGTPHATDCACNAGEVAVAGGGWCGSSGDLIESANIFQSSTSRNLSAWRVQCSAGAPQNFYALCMKASP
jgi:hypothetical protein